MPTYYRPKVAHVDPGGADVGSLVLIAAAIATAAAVVLFVLAHLVLLAVCAAAFVAVIGGLCVVFRRAASPRRWREYRYPRPTVRVEAARAAQAIAAPPRAIEAPRAGPAGAAPAISDHDHTRRGVRARPGRRGR
jgi:hypothetical protein